MKDRRHFLLGMGATAALAACDPKSVEPEDSDTGTGDTAPTIPEADYTDQVCSPEAPSDTCIDTPPMSEGPYFRDDTPERSRLDVAGDTTSPRLWLSGFVLGPDCAPLAGAKVYIWHANADGVYDTETEDFDCMGFVTTGEDGSWCARTILPERYWDYERDHWLARHIHIKVYVDGVVRLTTQLSFLDDEYAEEYGFTENILLDLEELEPGHWYGRQDFMLKEA